MGAKPARGSEAWWTDYLTQGHRLEGMARLLFPRLPASPRCKVCFVPFGGVGKVLRLFGWSPSRKNPKMCGFCSDRLPPGGAEVEVAVLVVDVRGYTALSETLTGAEVADQMSRFFDRSTKILMERDALIDKYLGDAVQALFVPGIAGPDYKRQAVGAALDLSRALSPQVPIGVAVHAGQCFVGNVGSGGMVDLTAMGDVVNTVHRLQGHAAPGEVIVSPDLVTLAPEPDRWHPEELILKGKVEPFLAYRYRPA